MTRDQFQPATLLHHAYVIPGDVPALTLHTRALITEVFNLSAPHPDYYERAFDSLGVDEARELKETAYLASIGERRIFVLGIHAITREAQNALLKLFEEPPSRVQFFLIVPTEEILMPTVRSRTELLRLSHEGEGVDAEKFLGSNPEVRLEIVKKVLDAKDKTVSMTFLRGISRALHRLLKEARREERGVSEDISKTALEAVMFAERYMRDPGASPKLLLEYMAISLPPLKSGLK